MNAFKKHRVAVIEPSAIIRQGIKSLLETGAPEWSVVRSYSDLHEFQASKTDTVFDVILINPAIISFYKQYNVRNLLSECPNTAIVAILYGHIDAKTLDSFDGTIDIYDSITRIALKLKKITKDFISQRKESSLASSNASLSDREKDILSAVAKGLLNKEIANKYNISIHTVVTHRKNITRKTGIKTVPGLTIYALFNNLVSQEELD